MARPGGDTSRFALGSMRAHAGRHLSTSTGQRSSIRSMSGGVRFEHRMSDSDALMWHIEKDPLLRSTITIVWWLDRMPDRERLEDRIERATRLIPRLRQHVVSNPYSIAPPRWEIDPHFDRRFHVRWMHAPGG